MKHKIAILLAGLSLASECQAFIVFPIPNLGFPPAISRVRDALEKSTDTKALAYVSEDSWYGGRFWVWGMEAGKMTQAAADASAMRKCEAALEKAKAETTGGKPLYDFGSKRCELYRFYNVTLNLPEPAAAPAILPAPALPSAPVADSTLPNVPAAADPAAAPAAAEAASIQAPPPSTLPQTIPNVVQKMRDLDALYRQNQITKEEYERKRRQLIDDL